VVHPLQPAWAPVARLHETDPARPEASTHPATNEGEAVKQPSYHEELAAHLAGQEQPLPHPISRGRNAAWIDPVKEQRLSDYRAAEVEHVKLFSINKAKVDAIYAQNRIAEQRLRDMGLTKPGPITMHEPSDFSTRVMGACVFGVAFLIGLVIGLSLAGAL
jgi:hypothetical protein